MAAVRRMVIFTEHFPPFLGSDRTIFELGKRFADKGVKVLFLATEPIRYLLGERPGDWSYKAYWKTGPPTVHKNITARYLLVSSAYERMWKKIPPIAYVLTVVLLALRSTKAVIRHRTDVIVAAHASPIVGVVAVLSAKLSRRPVVMSCPDWMSAYAAGLVGENLSSLRPALLQAFETILYGLSNRVVAVTGFLRRLLVRSGIDAERIALIPNGADTDVFNPSVKALDLREKYNLGRRCVILFSGHLEKWAGVSVLYDLAARLDKERLDSLILLVGAADPSTGLLKKLHDNNLDRVFVHVGVQPFEDMPKFVGVADIALSLFPNTNVSHAASPLKIFEYMAAGKAIVATSVSGTEEVLDNGTGVLVRPDASQELCDAVVNLCRNPDRRKQLGTNAREAAEQKYRWSVLADRFLEQCNIVLAKNRRQS